MNASLRMKLTAFAVVSVSAFIVILGLSYYGSNKVKSARVATDFVNSKLQDLSKAVNLEKSYLNKPSNQLESELVQLVSNIESGLRAQQSVLVEVGLTPAIIQQSIRDTAEYRARFEALAAQQKVIGLHPKDGEYGALRSAVHNVESLLKSANDYELLAAMLQLRRAEKDFMLRFDKKYLSKFEGLIQGFLASLASSNSDVDKAQIRERIADYEVKFRTLVEGEEKKGLTEDQGLRQQLKSQSVKAVASLNGLAKNIHDKSQNELDNIRYLTFFIGLVISIALVALSWLTVSSVSRRAKSLQTQIAKIESTKDLTTRINAKKGDEFGDIAVNINSFIDSIHNVLLRVVSSTSTLDHTTAVINDNATSANSGSEKQMQETAQIAQAIKEMSGTINELSKSTDDTSNDAIETANLAKTGMGQLSQVATDVSELASMLSQAEDRTGLLQQKSEEVNSVLSVITNIAEQTNLLALNAAIEAARAGDHGRGFAVVADEVRQLAMKTQESTVNISNIIESLKQEIASIVDVIQHSAENGEAVSSSTKEVNISLGQIVSKIDSVSEKNAGIATAIEEQGYTAEDISRNVEGISQVAKEAAERTKDNQSISKMLNEESESLSTMLAEFELGEDKSKENKTLKGFGFSSQ